MSRYRTGLYRAISRVSQRNVACMALNSGYMVAGCALSTVYVTILQLQRRHNRQLTTKADDRNIITRKLYEDVY